MEKEYLVNKRNEITLNITDGKIDAYREKEETQNTVRVYAKGKIGVAGSVGNADIPALEAQATQNLQNGIEYPCKLRKNTKKSILRTAAPLNEKKFMHIGKRLARKVAAACPRFLVNGQLKLCKAEGSYENTKNTEYAYENHELNVFFQVKDKDSSNIADAYYGAALTRYGEVIEKKIVQDVKTLHDVFFGEQITLPNGKYPMIFAPSEVVGNLINNFIAEYYVAGGSLFSGKLGEKIFNEKFSLSVDRNPVTNHESSFYDAEGEVATDYRAKLVDNGVFANVFTTKKTAKMFNLPVSKTSGAPYDGVPSLAAPGLYVKRTAPDLKTLLGAEKAVLVSITSGGDMTTEGVMGLPVQLAFLVENGKITARVTDFAASGNVKNMFNEDFVGVAAKGVFEEDNTEALVVRMELINNA